MSERLSAAEVVERLKAVEGEMRFEGDESGVATAVFAAALVQQHLVLQWQAEPTGDGWYWVEGWMEHPRYVQRSGESWTFSLRGYSMGPLLGRRVCPISGPPSDAKGGA